MDNDLEKLIKSWLIVADYGPGSQEYELHFWAYDRVSSYAIDQPEKLWEFIRSAYGQPMSRQVELLFAASPLEELIHDHGARYIDQIEELARRRMSGSLISFAEYGDQTPCLPMFGPASKP